MHRKFCHRSIHPAILLLTLLGLAAAPFPARPDLPIPPEEFTDLPPAVTSGCDNRLCWSLADKWAVAHICWDEARGLLTDGLVSCAAAIAQRQAHPEVWGSAELNELLRYNQFSVVAAQTRPWERGLPPPPLARLAVEIFLAGPTGPGCFGYDSFQTSTPAQAHVWLAQAPQHHCIVVREPQALLFFNWRDG